MTVLAVSGESTLCLREPFSWCYHHDSTTPSDAPFVGLVPVLSTIIHLAVVFFRKILVTTRARRQGDVQ
ncbi:hypothetical protein BDV18DRAFT_144146 [Aspergillus unguis]